jgi:hypothetical protein
VELSLPGLLVCSVLFMIGRWLGAAVLVGLFASLPFGSTAFATLSALGGASPLIYTAFALALIAITVGHRSFAHDIGTMLRHHPSAWVVVFLVLYAVGTSLLLPRLFAGATTAFTVYRGGILEVPLAPTSGNITQVAYFALGALVFFAVAVALTREDNLRLIRIGFFTYVVVNLILGAVDLAGKLGTGGDVLYPIRTANYSLLTEIAEGGFWRIVGGYPEASSFAIGCASCLAFSFVYWRSSGSKLALALAVASLALVLLSTSSTGYFALAVLLFIFTGVYARPLASGRIPVRDLSLVSCVMVLLTVLLAIYLAEAKLFEPVVKLVDTTLINKAQSQSGQERAYWNARSLMALVDTMGLGVGLGSSRASSWIVAVVSQLGIVGTALLVVLVGELLRGQRHHRLAAADPGAFALCRAARACGLGHLVGASISGGAADPGILFFICLAVVASMRRRFAATGELKRGFPRTGAAYRQADGSAR